MTTEDNPTGKSQLSTHPYVDIIEQIRHFEAWYQYGETVGQTRLYNFLMAASILFLACGNLIAANNFLSYFCSILLSGFGVFLSRFWKIYGKRQNKFILMFEVHMRRGLDELKTHNQTLMERSPAHHLLELKNNQTTFITQADGYCLADEERKVSTRETLFMVPRFFQFAFFITSLLSVVGCAVTLKPFINAIAS